MFHGGFVELEIQKIFTIFCEKLLIELEMFVVFEVL